MQAGVALVPNEELCRSLIQFQNNLREELELTPVLGSPENLPHLTLIQGRFRSEAPVVSAAKQVQVLLRLLAEPPTLTLEEIRYVPQGWMFLMVHSDSWLKNAHEVAFGELRAELKLWDQDRGKDISAYTPAEAENFTRYGYRFIGSCFSPHITLGRNPGLTSERCRCLSQRFLPELQTISTAAARVTAYELGPNGSHARTILELAV